MKIQAKSNADSAGSTYRPKALSNGKPRPGSLAAIVAAAKIAREKGLDVAIKVAH